MNNTFDIERFFNTLKLDIATNWRRFSFAFFGALACLFCMFVLTLSDYKDYLDPSIHNEALNGMATCSYVCLMFYSILCGGLMFNNMKTKQRRISFLMLPASNLEKFLSRWLMSTVGAFLVFLVALLVADIGRAVIGIIMGLNPHGSVFLSFFGIGFEGIPKVLSYIGDMFVSGRGDYFFYILSCFVVAQAVFVLGGALFRRHAVLLTILTMIVLSSVLGPFGFFALFFDLVDGGQAVIGIVLNLLVIAACYYGAYRLFCRSEVISHKWLNL